MLCVPTTSKRTGAAVRASRSLLRLASLLLLPMGAHVAFAGPGFWTSNGPDGGTVLTVAIEPTDPQTLYAGADNGGVFKSTDGGTSWRSANTGLTSFVVRAIIVDPMSPDTVYIGTNGGVFKSTDGAATWRTVNTGLAGLSVRALVIDPCRPADTLCRRVRNWRRCVQEH